MEANGKAALRNKRPSRFYPSEPLSREFHETFSGSGEYPE